MPLKPPKAPSVNFLNSNKQDIHEDLKYTEEDIKHVEEWVKRHVETTWHSLGVSAPSTFPSRPPPCKECTSDNSSLLIDLFHGS